MRSPEPLIELCNVNYAIGGHTIFEDFSLKVYPHDRLAILGKNASGKSTLLQLLFGLKKPTSGTIKYHPKLGETFRARKKHVGAILHDVSLDKEMTVFDNMKLIACLYGLPSDDGAVKQHLEAFDLLAYKSSRVKTLSYGTQRRVDIARAFLHKPQYFFLDEVTSGLDVHYKSVFWKAFETMPVDDCLGIAFTTHDLTELKFSSRILLLEKGRLIVDMTCDEIQNDLDMMVLTLPNDVPGEFIDDVSTIVGDPISKENQFVFHLKQPSIDCPIIWQCLAKAKIMTSIQLQAPSLNDIMEAYLK